MTKKAEGLSGLSVEALRAKYTENAERIKELREKADRTIVEARELKTLTAESNEIADLVGEGQSEGEALKTLPDVPETRATIETKGDPALTADDTEKIAEAVAAAAELSTTVAQSEETIETRVERRSHRDAPSIVASAADPVRPGVALGLTDIGAIAFDLSGSGRQGRREHIVSFHQEGIDPVVTAGAGPAANTKAMVDWIREDEDDAVTAAPFTVCGPPDILRDVPECDNTERYVPDWFRTIPSAHGQVQFYRSFSLADALPGTAVWDQADQAGVVDDDPDTWKPCIELDCLATQTVGVEAVTQCITMKLIDTMTSPEAVASMLHAARAALARTADGHLLYLLDNLLSWYTHDASTGLGATVQVYDVLGRLLGVAAASNRQLDLSGYTLAVESGFMAHLMLDNTMACNPRLAQEAADDLFSGLGIGDIQVTPDWNMSSDGGPWSGLLPINPVGHSAIALPDRPTTWRVRLFKSGDFAMLTPGGESFGVVPDLANKRKNKVTWFGELFQGLGKLGCSPGFMLEFYGLCATGTRSACTTVECEPAS